MGKSSKKGGKKASPTGTASAGTSPASHSPEPKSQVEGAPAEPEPVAHANGGAPHTPAKSGSKAPAPLPEAVKEVEAEREAREAEGLQRGLARAEAALAALRTEHEDLVALRAQLSRSVHRLEEEVAEERDAADAARAAHSRARLAAYGLGASTALSLIALGVVAARCSRRGA